jgi:hypothetical protein
MNDLLLYWFMYVSTGAMVGAFIGTLLAFGIAALIKKLNKWYRSL